MRLAIGDQRNLRLAESYGWDYVVLPSDARVGKDHMVRAGTRH